MATSSNPLFSQRDFKIWRVKNAKKEAVDVMKNNDMTVSGKML